MNKQVYATLKIDDNRLQIIVAEYFNTRFNIIASYNNPIGGIVNYKIVDKEKVLNELKKGIDTVSKKIGAKLKKVVLVLPPYNFNRIPLKVSVIPSDGVIRNKDIARAITNSLKTNVGDNSIVCNTLISKYTFNGISSRRFVENEKCEEAYLDIDLLCIDKEMAYAFVKIVSEAGLEVLDICLNNYAIAKESISLDNSINKNIILLDIGKGVTYLSLLSKGRLMGSEIIYDGLSKIEDEVYKEYHLPYSSIARLIKYNVNYNSSYPNDAVFAWNKDNKSYSITAKELSDFVLKPLDEYLDKLVTMCKPIIEKGADIWVSGEGSDMEALISKLKEKAGCDVKTYYPDTIGVRNSQLCAVYGALYIYKEKANLNNLSVECVDMIEYENVVNDIKEDEESETITSKIRNLFEMYKDKGEI